MKKSKIVALLVCLNGLYLSGQEILSPTAIKHAMVDGLFTHPMQDLHKTKMQFNLINQHNTQPFFCKMEDQWAKSSPIQVKFRVGNVQYTDYLERKTTAYYQP